MHNYIFDLDGTIVDTSKEILICLKQAFVEAEYRIDDCVLKEELIGPPIKEIIKNISPAIEPKMMERVVTNFRKIYDNKNNDTSIMYEGMMEFLQSLKLSDKKMFVATMKPARPTCRLVKAFDLNMFEDIYTVDKYDKPMTKAEMVQDIIEKYSLKRDKTVMVGDTLSDIRAAKNAKIKSVAVLWGYEHDKNMLINEADCAINKIGELKWEKLNYQTI